MIKSMIEEINKKCPYGQGVFVQPSGIPIKIKTPVIYTRYLTGGAAGGSCFDEDGDSGATDFVEDEPKNKWKVLDIVLEYLKPNITYLQYKKVLELVHDNTETEHDYYGNYSEYRIEYIVVSELEKLLFEIS
jgi:hypothetical protein